jgi:hypothetical protein
MAGLVQHILRGLAPHAERFADLATKTVSSAAVTDEQTRQWSQEMYARDLADWGLA